MREYTIEKDGDGYWNVIYDKDRKPLKGLYTQNPERILIGPVIAVSFSAFKDPGEKGWQYVLHKIGRPDWVKEWWEDAVKRFIMSGSQDLADELKYFETDQITSEDATKMRTHSGWMPSFIREYFENIKVGE